SDDTDAALAGKSRGYGGGDPGFGRSDADAEANLFENLQLYAPQGAGKIVVEGCRAEEIEIEDVVRVRIDGGGKRFQDGKKTFGEFGVAMATTRDDSGVGAECASLDDEHAAGDAEERGFITGGDDDLPPDHEGFTAEARADGLFHGCEETFDVHVNHVGCMETSWRVISRGGQ